MDYGPKMLALAKDQHRRFCEAYARTGNAMQSTREAGYAAEKMTGWRLLLRQDIQEALEECMASRLKELTPMALNAMQDVLGDRNHKDYGKVVFGVLDRVGFHAKSEHLTKVEHSLSDTEVVKQLRALAKEFNMDPAALLGSAAKPKMIEARVVDAEVIEEDWENF